LSIDCGINFCPPKPGEEEGRNETIDERLAQEEPDLPQDAL
jgi:hypothetical protein